MDLLNRNNLLNNKANLYGIEGFLLLLCFSLTILTPVFNLITILPSLEKLQYISQILKSEFNIVLLFFTTLIINSLITILSIITGILLWIKKRIGVLLAKILFIIIIIFNSFSLIYIILSKIYIDNITIMIVSCIAPYLWLIYLHKSVRVKNTYFKGNVDK